MYVLDLSPYPYLVLSGRCCTSRSGNSDADDVENANNIYELNGHPYLCFDEHKILGTKAVGWLSSKHDFCQGETSSAFKSSLFMFCKSAVRRTRGFHTCEFCKQCSSSSMCQEEGLWLGSAEIRVFYQDRVYAAPDLIYHYVLRHQYKPPDEFIEAVLEGPKPGDVRYEELVKKLPDS